MRVAYHFTVPLPAEPELDAAFQDALHLARRHPGEIGSIYPAARFRRTIPPLLCGFAQRPRLARLDREVDLHHVFSHGLHPYPALSRLRRPVVYTIGSTLGPRARPWFTSWLRGLGAVVTASPRDRDMLAGWGIDSARLVPAGIDLARFSRGPRPDTTGFVVMAGSAPWDDRQIETKGIGLLARAVDAMPALRVILLMRGVVVDAVERLVRRSHLEDRIEIIRSRVDVNAVLARAHASIVLARSPQLVKAYPHSLLESLAAGRPVVVSRTVDMAELVRSTGCGEVVAEFSLDHVLRALRAVAADLGRYEQRVAALDLSVFSHERLVAAYENIYREAVRGRPA